MSMSSTSPAPRKEPPAPTVQGSFRLFRLLGTDVFLHWSWFAVAVFQIQGRQVPYSSLVWNIVEYVAGFGIVLLHEFGHVLACRQVGGSADRVVLWPLGGLAFVAPPPRPAANLWTTAAGPLVNVVLAPVFIGLVFATMPPPEGPLTDIHLLSYDLAIFNAAILIFNLLPIYPLDGGRMLQALLWFVLGRATSLKIVAVLGLVASAGLGGLAIWVGDFWLGIMVGFLALGAFGGLSYAKLLAKLEGAPRRTDVVCPACGSAPPRGDFWRCIRCQQWFDLFNWGAGVSCPKGGNHALNQTCLDCGRQVASPDWVAQAPAPRDDVKIEPWYANQLLRSTLKGAFDTLSDDTAANRRFFEVAIAELRTKPPSRDVSFGLFCCDVGLACHGSPAAGAEAYAIFPEVSFNPTARSLACWLCVLFPLPDGWNPDHDSARISAWIREHADRLSWSEAEDRFELRETNAVR